MTYQRRSTTESGWQIGSKHYAVRVFSNTRKLIWSSWIETAEVPIFDEGTAQTFEAFERGDSFPVLSTPPEAVLREIRAFLSEEAKPKDSLFRRLRHR